MSSIQAIAKHLSIGKVLERPQVDAFLNEDLTVCLPFENSHYLLSCPLWMFTSSRINFQIVDYNQVSKCH